MQRDIFLELLSKLDENCNKILVGTEKDYRRLIPTEGSTQVYFQLFFIYVLKFGWEHQHSIKELASTSVNPMI
jgi:hypothetical protein